ncbi:germacrene A synthase-like [Salvia hispanica]|uniref:germacrene A synthase-like n=1 Tax=Salvia hispanica TaxID=49212 RepID=UPI002009D48C|nr:germacrene A synthase-like [Salvia hispanica]
MAALNSNSFNHRPESKFPPSLWGDHFINHVSDSKVVEKYSKTVEVMKSDVRNLLTAPQTKMIDTMNLIDTLERLGVSYHFENDIEEKLQQYFHLNTNYHDDEAYDLYTVALHFRLFRQHGHPISSEIFSKWTDGNGKFNESIKSDAKGMLSLYEASYLRTRGETILDEALAFTTATLKSMVPNLRSPLKKNVELALVQPLHFGIPRLEAHSYITMYEEEELRNETLIKFAKIDYNLLQMLHREELQQVSRWWKELGLISKLPYARDRIVECFFWAVALHYEPQYSLARVFFAKSAAMISVIDDTYDAYGTIEELEVFTEAIQRWDFGELSRLPDYMRPLYKAILELYMQFEDELAKEGRSYASFYAIEGLKELVRCYFKEAKWFIKGNLPPFEEYLKLGVITSTVCYLVPSCFMGIGSARKEDFEWLSKKPKILVAACTIGRLVDDVGSYEGEMERGQLAIGVESYVKENGVTKEEAMAKFMELAMNAWKDTNKEMLRPSCYKSRDLLTVILNFERLVDVTYKDKEDGYTHPEKVLKPLIIDMFVDAFEV